jgi:hypothetical protein
MSHYRNLGGGRRDKNEPEIMQRFRAHGWHPEQVSGNRQWDLNVYPPRPTSTGSMNRCLTLVCHVDVKGSKGKVEDAQREKWAALSEKGIPVYVCRTEADVDALVSGELEPWQPDVMGLKATADALFTPGRRVHLRPGVTGMGHAVEPLMRDESSIKAKVREVGESMARTSVEARDEARRKGRRVPKGGAEERERQRKHTETCGPKPSFAPPRPAPVDVRTRPPGKVRKEWRPPQTQPVDAAKEAAETFAPPTVTPCENAKAGCANAAVDDAPWCSECTP